MAITKLKRGETYFYVDGWTGVKGEPGTMVPKRVVEIEAVTGGANRPKVRYSGSSYREHFIIFLGSTYGENAVWATREEAEAAKVVIKTPPMPSHLTLERCKATAELWFDEADDILVTLETDSALTREIQIHLIGEIRSCLANYRHAMETHVWLQMKPAAPDNSTKLKAA